ncbi:MAG: alpha/beta hydrolase family protein [Oliverpabstia sp.]
MGVIHVPHYEMAENAAELRRYLEQGWAVASPTEVLPSHNGLLTDDDLVFNNAALYILRHMEEFDTERIAVVGGSAGGYTAMMLSALQMGNCATIATAPIANVYFNFYQYFQMAKRDDAPFFLKIVRDSFAPILNHFPDASDTERWEAFSAVGLANCYSSPFVITHVTSDILVPIDQITRAFTYAHEGDSMPEGFSTRLSEENPGVLGHSLVDELPVELTNVEHIIIDDPNENSSMPYDAEKLFNILIYDDGPTQSYGSHRATSGTGIIDDVPYLKAMFERGLAQNEVLTSGKLLLLLERYMGESIQLPAHEGVDDTVYGSLAVYRREIVEELTCWVSNHSLAELDAAVMEVISSLDDIQNKNKYMTTWEEICNDLK